MGAEVRPRSRDRSTGGPRWPFAAAAQTRFARAARCLRCQVGATLGWRRTRRIDPAVRVVILGGVGRRRLRTSRDRREPRRGGLMAPPSSARRAKQGQQVLSSTCQSTHRICSGPQRSHPESAMILSACSWACARSEEGRSSPPGTESLSLISVDPPIEDERRDPSQHRYDAETDMFDHSSVGCPGLSLPPRLLAGAFFAHELSECVTISVGRSSLRPCLAGRPTGEWFRRAPRRRWFSRRQR